MRILQKFRLLLPFIVFLVIMFFLRRGLGHDPHKIPSPLINKPFPQFTIDTLGSGNTNVTKQQLLGHVVLLNVWASWCMSCRMEQPVLMDIARSHKVTLVGLNYKDQRADAKKWLNKAGNPYSMNLFDPNGQLGINLGVYGTPEMFLIDQKGIIRYKYIGPISSQAWKEEILPQVMRLEG